jgi:hypothetical protein
MNACNTLRLFVIQLWGHTSDCYGYVHKSELFPSDGAGISYQFHHQPAADFLSHFHQRRRRRRRRNRTRFFLYAVVHYCKRVRLPVLKLASSAAGPHAEPPSARVHQFAVRHLQTPRIRAPDGFSEAPTAPSFLPRYAMQCAAIRYPASDRFADYFRIDSPPSSCKSGA